jgi:hypothetical protein
MSELEKIYYTYMDDIGLGKDSDEIIRAGKILYEQLDKKGLSSCEFEDYIGDLTSEHEKQGFLNGFKYAMSIALECMQIKTA